MTKSADIFKERIESVRALMAERGWSAAIISGSDPHFSEYVAPRWRVVEWITGYSGEGDLVITASHIGLWTDSRYFIQASAQLEAIGGVLHKTRVAGEVPIPQWLKEQFRGVERVRIGVDSLCISADSAWEINRLFGGRDVVRDSQNWIDGLWKDRPDAPETTVRLIDEKTAGMTRAEKLKKFQDYLKEQHADGILLTSLDEIAWVLNVRGQDIAYNPFVMSYLLVTKDGTAFWYVLKGLDKELEKSSDIRGTLRQAFSHRRQSADPVTEASFLTLESEGIRIMEYDCTASNLSAYITRNEADLIIDTSTTCRSIVSATLRLAKGYSIERGKSPVSLWKSVKNSAEISGMRKAHLADGTAMENFLYWLETSLAEGKVIDEYAAVAKMHELRSSCPEFRDESFETISAYGPGAALPHYVTPKEGSAVLERKGLYLCDSGGQYIFGTTDITRTVPLGPCTRLEKEDYTLVLKGHIALSKAIFPKGTPGCRLDAIARAPLWNTYRNFGHGTGHGVGCFLGVHEGPQDIRQNLNPQEILPGMVTSIEPGIYREGLHGVRHENLVLCTAAESNGFGDWLRFEPLTLCHFDTSALIPEMLDSSEKDWLNSYNEKVFRTLSPHLPSEVAKWLRTKTLPV